MSFLADGQVVGGTASPWLDLVAATSLALAVVLFVRKGRPMTILILLIGAVVIGIGSVAVAPKPVAAPDATLSITSPTPGATVPAGTPIPVAVDLRGGRLTTSTIQTAPNVGHLHVFVDGAIVSMPASSRAPVTLSPGEHDIKVEFVTATHQPFTPPIEASVHVTAKRR